MIYIKDQVTANSLYLQDISEITASGRKPAGSSFQDAKLNQKKKKPLHQLPH
jgi:hypothetical protein